MLAGVNGVSGWFCTCFPVVFCVGLASAFLVIAYQRRERRRRALARVASRLNVSFFPDHVGGRRGLFSTDADGGPYRHIEPFQRGHGERASNTLRGTLFINGGHRDFWAGDWQYTLGSGDDRSVHHFSYLLIGLPGPAPRVWLREEGFLDSLAATIGFNDLDFSDRYHVSSDDPRFAYDLFHPRMIEMVLRLRPRSLRIGDGYLLLQGDDLWEPDLFESKVIAANRFLACWPRHLAADVHGRL